jgi:phage terminase large subunit
MIEEAGEVEFKAFDILKSRIGRQLNDQYGLLRKIYLTFNPKRNWIYPYLYKRYVENLLPPHTKFLQALLWDNPHREQGYEAALLSITDPVTKARLLDGSFEYDNDPTALCNYDAILDAFTNESIKEGDFAISADLAMQGRDRFVAGIWSGLICTIAIDQEKSTGKSIETGFERIDVERRH